MLIKCKDHKVVNFDDNVIPFSNIVRRFFKRDEFSEIRNINFKIRLGWLNKIPMNFLI